MVAAGVVGAVAAMVLAWWAGLVLGGVFALLWIVAGRADRFPAAETRTGRHGDDGALAGCGGVHGDITQRKRAEDPPLDKMALLEAQVNASPDGMLVVDAHNRRILSNPRMLELFNVPQHVVNDPDNEALLKHVTSLNKHPDQFLEKVRYLYDHIHEKGVDEIELKDGRVLDRYSSPVFGKNGEYYGRIWIFRDVTAQRQAEEQMRKLSQVVEQSPSSVMITDLSGTIEYVNPAFTETFGYTAREVIGENPRILNSGLTPPDTYSELWRELKAGREWYGELQNRRKNGEIIWQLIHIAPLRNARGQITHYTAVKENITARKAMEDALRLAALTDKLTGLPNRTLFGDRLQQAILRAKRHKEYHFAVLFLDFDRFKTINDSLGHYVGDLLLKEVAHRLSMTMRSSDSLCRAACDGVAARLGGDEFVILLDSLQSPDDATMVADRLIADLSRPYRLGQHEVCSTVSIGVVTSRSGEDSAEEVLRDADTAMYEAKLAGKGRYVVFDASMHDRVQDRLNLENDLRSAIGTDQLFLMYQPLVSLRTGQIDGFEALVRWKHPEKGILLPGVFIPIAEDTGLILSLGEWVLREACAQFARWRKAMGAAAPGNIRVNLSRHQLVLADLPETLKQILAATGMAPRCLHLEVIEGAMMKDVTAAVRMLQAIRQVGVKLDVDDFGTGYSSLACLRQFPIDGLKIDRSFVAALDRGRDLVALVQAVTQLARNLKLCVVAEGIETVEQALTLQSLECDLGQGFFFSEPLMADQVVSFKLQPDKLPGQLACENPAVGAA
jgi:diguanylate cyclase (GGDEF)-like protein/PAS domain S-box-containing protein